MYASTLPRSNWLRRASIRLAWYRHMPASSIALCYDAKVKQDASQLCTAVAVFFFCISLQIKSAFKLWKRVIFHKIKQTNNNHGVKRSENSSLEMFPRIIRSCRNRRHSVFRLNVAQQKVQKIIKYICTQILFKQAIIFSRQNKKHTNYYYYYYYFFF